MKPGLPLLSVIIATYQRPRQLLNCLAALSRQHYAHNRFEVIVVDDGGGISLTKVLERFKNKLNLTLLQQENTGAPAARNAGAARAKGEFLVFTDDDCIPAADWLKCLAEKHKRASDCASKRITSTG